MHIEMCINANAHQSVKGTLQAKYEFSSVYRAVHADFSSAVHFLIHVLVYEILLDISFFV